MENEIKTLKDIGEVTTSGAFVCNYNELKQEAIKRAKYYLARKMRLDEGSPEWHYCRGCYGAEVFAHDLTEEDLKDETKI